MQDRRKQPRKTLMSYTQVYDLYAGRLIGYLADLNVSGAMVIADRRMPEATALTLAIELPELGDVRAGRMTLAARVAWCKADLSPDYVNIGFEFQELRPEQARLIESVIDQYEFRRDMPRYSIKPSSSRPTS